LQKFLKKFPKIPIFSSQRFFDASFPRSRRGVEQKNIAKHVCQWGSKYLSRFPAVSSSLKFFYSPKVTKNETSKGPLNRVTFF